MEKFRAVITRERAMDDMTIEVEARMQLPAHTLEKIVNRIKQTIKLTGMAVQVESGTIPEDAAEIDDRRKWD